MKLKYFFFLFLTLTIIHQTSSIATVRYVSKTGTSTPPYTSWETAADSIQKCINICSFGDTVYVANGVYKEKVIMSRGLALIGAGIDSCIIDTRQIPFTSPHVSITGNDSCYIEGFHILNYTEYVGTGIEQKNSKVKYCKIEFAGVGINASPNYQDYRSVNECIVSKISNGIICYGGSALITNNIISANFTGLTSQILSTPTYINNIINSDNCWQGYYDGLGYRSVLKNNIFYGNGDYAFESYQNDSIVNNVTYGHNGIWNIGVFGSGTKVLNNNIQNTNAALYYDQPGGSPQTFRYNNLWKNGVSAVNITIDSTNIYNDPMFVNADSMDFHLQKHSPLIDAGDPTILDKDGSRSDIGVWGGPYGEKYTYRDLAPKPPSNLTAVMDSGLVKLTWNKNTESDFSVYRVYRDTVADYMYDTTKIIVVLSDTVYFDDPPHMFISGNYYYKITALDNTLHQSAPSEEAHINITGVPEAPPIVVEHYRLLNNYPNPFNSSTIIPYRLKEGGYVKINIYDIKGELVRVLVNEYQSAGYYEARFSPTESERNVMDMEWETGYNDDVASGIYLYQIMVRGEGDIPVFTDMGKMILLK